MIRRVRKSARAERDINEITDWIARDSGNSALKWLDDLERKLLIIQDNPGIGTERRELRRGLRSYAFGNYLIFFQPTRMGVDIVRVIHGARDYRGFFK